MKQLYTLLLIAFCTMSSAQSLSSKNKISSPNSKLEAIFEIKDGKAFYSLSRKGIQVINASRLGLIGRPMDYTPGIFKLRNYAPAAPARQTQTTLAKQLAFYVTMYNPLQMTADLPENYEPHLDAFQFIKDVALDWDDTKVIEAEPGDYITIARKEKGKANWFVGAIADETGRKTAIPLNFLDKGKKYTAIVYRDAEDANWQLIRKPTKLIK